MLYAPYTRSLYKAVKRGREVDSGGEGGESRQ